MGVPLDLVQQTSYIDDHDNLNGIQGSKLASSQCSKFFGLSSKAVMQCLARLECWAFLRMRPSRGTKWKDRASRLDDAVLTLLVTWFWVYWLLDANTRSSANRTVEDGVERLPSSWEKYNVVIIMCLCGVGHPLTSWAGFSNFTGGVRTWIK